MGSGRFFQEFPGPTHKAVFCQFLMWNNSNLPIPNIQNNLSAHKFAAQRKIFPSPFLAHHFAR